MLKIWPNHKRKRLIIDTFAILTYLCFFLAILFRQGQIAALIISPFLTLLLWSTILWPIWYNYLRNFSFCFYRLTPITKSPAAYLLSERYPPKLGFFDHESRQKAGTDSYIIRRCRVVRLCRIANREMNDDIYEEGSEIWFYLECFANIYHTHKEIIIHLLVNEKLDFHVVRSEFMHIDDGSYYWLSDNDISKFREAITEYCSAVVKV